MANGDFNVDYVANLARLSLTDEEKALFGKQLPAILHYVDKIAALDVADIEPTLHGQPVNNIFREDVPVPSLDRETVLENAPQRVDDEFRMPKVVE